MGMQMKKQVGFSLMEVMIVVVIVGILVAVAVPSYRSYVENNRRTLAGACLVELSQFMERVYTTSMAYNLHNGAATALPASSCQNALAGQYSFALNATATTYSLSATPAGAQSSDSCGVLTLNQAGQQTADGQSTAAKIKQCWG